MIFYKAFFFDNALKWTMLARNMKRNSNLKIFKVMQSTTKSRFNHLLLSITFDDKFSRVQLDALRLSI